MPVYNVGEHRVDHPPLFACREHKALLRFTPAFVKEIFDAAQDLVPGNLAEYAAGILQKEDAFKLPEYLVPPRMVIFNPDGLRGVDALPYVVCFIDKRFCGIPAKYLTQSRFEGCPECGGESEEAAADRARSQAPVVVRAQQNPSSSGVRPGTRPPSERVAKQPPPSGTGVADSKIIRKAPIPGVDNVPSPKGRPPRRD
jgi:hypothetical protein